MAQRRVSELSFNFDSLTDLVTNLAGALIMIVLLFFGLSSERVKRAAREASMGTARGGEPQSDNSSRLPALRVETNALEAQLKKRQDEIEKLRSQIAEMDREAARMQPKEYADPEGKEGKPVQVAFRPPMLRATQKRAAVTFIMLHNRAYFYKDVELLNAVNEILSDLNKAVAADKDTSGFEAGIVRRLPGGDFNVTIKVSNLKRIPGGFSAVFQGTLGVKPDAKGETEAEARTAGSNYSVLINALDADQSLVEFGVYPDSFDLFRSLRGPVLDRGLGYKWDPYVAGEDVVYTFTNSGNRATSF
jgi:hypothetical protein